jgi:hypothetical protein
MVEREAWDVTCGDTAPAIPAAHHLWRRFIDDANHITWDGDRPIPHPVNPDNIHMEKGEDGLSTSWREHLETDGLGPESVIEGNGQYTLVGELRVADAGALQMPVTHDPTGNTPIDCAHTVVEWPPGLLAPGSDRPAKNDRTRIKNDLARGFDFVHGQVETQKPAGM